MPWWFWVLLWTMLVLASLTVLVSLAWSTGRRFFAALHEVEVLGEDMTTRWEHGAEAVARGIRRAPLPGVLVPVRQARQDFLHQRQTRNDRRIAQRIARRERLGQPQRMGDLRRDAMKGKIHG